MLDRGEKFELLVDRTDKLNRQSVKFERSTVELRKTMWRRNVKLWMLLVFVGLVRFADLSLLYRVPLELTFSWDMHAQFVIYLVVSMACGFDMSGCGGKND